MCEVLIHKHSVVGFLKCCDDDVRGRARMVTEKMRVPIYVS